MWLCPGTLLVNLLAVHLLRNYSGSVVKPAVVPIPQGNRHDAEGLPRLFLRLRLIEQDWALSEQESALKDEATLFILKIRRQQGSRIQVSKVYLITGTSSGFGRSLAEAVLGRGDKVVLTAFNYPCFLA